MVERWASGAAMGGVSRSFQPVQTDPFIVGSVLTEKKNNPI
jgi:hypothetical protein